MFRTEAVNVWKLHDIKDLFLEKWNDINLYTKIRGINRFKGIVVTWEASEAEGIKMPDISRFKKWTETTPELSTPALEREIEKTGDEQLGYGVKLSTEQLKNCPERTGLLKEPKKA